MKVTAERFGKDRILAQIPYAEGEGAVLAKKVPGATPRFKRGTGRDKFLGWAYPLTMDTARGLRRVFGRENVTFGQELADWGRREQDLERTLAKIRETEPEACLALLARTYAYAPVLWEAMENRPMQATAALFASLSRQVLIADQPGVGKTLETLSALVEGNARTILVFARKTALTTVWEREIYRWLGEMATVYVADGEHDRRASAIQAFGLAVKADSALPCGWQPSSWMKFLVLNSEMARIAKVCQNGRSAAQCKKHCDSHPDGKRPKYEAKPAWPELFGLPPFDAIVLDESHRVLAGLGDRSLLAAQVRNGMMKLPRRPDTMALALSGTPWRGDRTQAWGTLNWLRPDFFSSRWRWLETYFEMADGNYGERVIGELIRPKAFDREQRRWTIRRTKKEVAPDMPEKEYAGSLLDPSDPSSPFGVWLEMTPEQQAAYDTMQANGDAEILGGRLTTASVLAEVTRLRQFASSFGRLSGDEFFPVLPSNKLNWIKDFLDELDGSAKVIIASQFTKLINLLAEELRGDLPFTLALTGQTSPGWRVKVQDFFQESPKHNLILVNTLAGGESINLSAANYMVMVDETNVPDEQEQMEDRGHRVGNATGLTVYYLRSLGTIEEEIARRTGAREGRVKDRLDGARGIDIRKRMIPAKVRSTG
jgi:SNF2 family DNA or RNA helicase